MGLLSDIKDKLFRRKLQEERARSSRRSMGSQQPINTDNARCILILFPADSSTDRKVVDKWVDAHRKQGQKIKIAGFFSQDVGETNFGFPVISPRNLNWYGIPKEDSLVEIKRIDCDLILRLGPVIHKELDYLATIQQAGLKVGPFKQDLEDTPYHLQFDAGRAESIRDQLTAIEQIFSFTNAHSTT
ncbi:DUF6913 domain-containing protein [Neolewinella agarilytica]|uniref:Uncharacterized protein n=1 Tax=Neolewinella agarilytica TaxID=478744 RepID=A0A1H9JJ91_9BACT|nr:hypothetical protein [Neolewinella agarilytica]SEQ86857.1 hypothetical protein SAMN05444359_11797 [Neolewinella agarilytica]